MAVISVKPSNLILPEYLEKEICFYSPVAKNIQWNIQLQDRSDMIWMHIYVHTCVNTHTCICFNVRGMVNTKQAITHGC